MPFEKVPTAVNCNETPVERTGLAGFTTMDSNTAGLTVKRVLPEIEPTEAVIIEVPAATAVASPVVFMVAVARVPDVQLGDERTWEVPSE